MQPYRFWAVEVAGGIANQREYRGHVQRLGDGEHKSGIARGSPKYLLNRHSVTKAQRVGSRRYQDLASRVCLGRHSLDLMDQQETRFRNRLIRRHI